MKINKLKILVLISLLTIGWGCEDILEEPTPDFLITEDNFFNDPDNVFLAITGMYDPISWGQNTYTSGGFSHSYEFIFGDICSDNALKGSEQPDQIGIQQLKTFTADPGNANIIAIWNKHWAAIARANLVLKNLPNTTISDNLKTEYEGEARFIRAYSYFTLNRIFGGLPTFDAPISTDEINGKNFKKDPLYVNFQLIEEDLNIAMTALPAKGNGRAPGRATSGAAASYLARVIMFQIGTDNTNNHNWNEVLSLTDELINGNYGSYALASNYATIFEAEGENNEESIFEIQALDNGIDAGDLGTGSMWTIFQNPQSLAGWGFNVPTQDLYDSYEPNDPRRACSVVAVGEYAYGEQMEASIRNQTGLYHRKAIIQPDLWTSNGGTEKGSHQNIRKFRYADVLLMNAEAAYHTGDNSKAIQRLSEIRDRASASTYPKGWDPGDPLGYQATALTPLDNGLIPAGGQALLDFIKLERRRELAMEATRMWDLVRWGDYESAINNSYFDEHDPTNTGFASEVAQNFAAHALGLAGQESTEQVIVNPIPLFPIPSFDAVGWGISQNIGY